LKAHASTGTSLKIHSRGLIRLAHSGLKALSYRRRCRTGVPQQDGARAGGDPLKQRSRSLAELGMTILKRFPRIEHRDTWGTRPMLSPERLVASIRNTDSSHSKFLLGGHFRCCV